MEPQSSDTSTSPQTQDMHSGDQPTVAPVFVQPSFQQQSIKTSGPLAPLEQTLEHIFSRLPQLPDFVRDMAARMLPWLTIMICVILAPLILIGLGMGGFLGFITSFYQINTNPFFWITLALLTAQAICLIAAVPKLLRDARAGWSLLFTACVLSVLGVVANIFAQFVPSFIGVTAGLSMNFLALYVLFQVRAFYTN